MAMKTRRYSKIKNRKLAILDEKVICRNVKLA
jgi:hypothetical protein